MTLEGLLLCHFPVAYEEKRAQVEAELQKRARWDSVGMEKMWEWGGQPGPDVRSGGVMSGSGSEKGREWGGVREL